MAGVSSPLLPHKAINQIAKGKAMRKLITMLISLALLGMVVISITTGCGARPSIVTKEKFEQLQDGMTYDEVVKTVGNPGKLQPAPALPPASAGGPPLSQRPDTKDYVWKNDDKSSMTASFTDNKMTSHFWEPAPTN